MASRRPPKGGLLKGGSKNMPLCGDLEVAETARLSGTPFRIPPLRGMVRCYLPLASYTYTHTYTYAYTYT